jgi:hypothetical protein
MGRHLNRIPDESSLKSIYWITNHTEKDTGKPWNLCTEARTGVQAYLWKEEEEI